MEKNLTDALKDYFESTSKEQIKKDWEKSEKYDKVDSPTIEEFIVFTKTECSF